MTQGANSAAGLFITLEGGEGAGKSTQIEKLSEYLISHGHDVVMTREPGGTRDAELLRAIILDPAHDWDPLEQLLLFNTARHNHWRRIIQPALVRGAIVLCDRYLDSTIAYQGAAGGISAEMVLRMHETVFGQGAMPDLTLYLDVPVPIALQRRLARDAGATRDRFEAADTAFHENLRDGFLNLCERFPARISRVDGAVDAASVFAAIVEKVNGRLGNG